MSKVMRTILARLISDKLNSGVSLVSMDSTDLNTDQKRINRLFRNWGEKITVSKDPNGNKLWFKKKQT